MAATKMKGFILYLYLILSLNSAMAQVWFGETKPAGKRCLFDPCDSGVQFCKNEGKCNLDERNCMFVCHCQDGYTGSKCESKMENRETDEGDKDDDKVTSSSRVTTAISTTESDEIERSTVKSIEDRTCKQGFICNHGVCDKIIGIKCSCDNGWTGKLCSIKSVNKSTSQIPFFEATEEPLRTDDKKETTELIRRKESNDVCSSEYVLRPQHRRTCAEGVYCVYGYCTNFVDWYNCTCDKGAVGSRCDRKCCLKCGEHGFCSLRNETEYCRCEIGYTGFNCDDKAESNAQIGQQEENWYFWLLGACGCMFMILLFMLVLLPYLLWYKRNKTIMKAVYSFQSFEDNDAMKWDAFVSYKSDGLDEEFVNNKLKTVLEGEFGFSLCLPKRDFQDNITLEQNMIDAIINSRRIIIVLTAKYIQREYPQYDYHCQHEILKRKTQVIPIILEDISAVNKFTDPVLKKSINHICCLKWSNEEIIETENEFWEKMKLSMPKRRTLRNWSCMRKVQKDNYLNDKEIALTFSENGEFLCASKEIETKQDSEEVDIKNLDVNSKKLCGENEPKKQIHVYENVAFY